MDVKIGFWKDYSQSGWSSSMITVKIATGALIISGLTIFITLVGARFWAIVAFAIHQCRSKDLDKDGLHYQHQLVYRNSTSQLGTAWHLSRIGWAWRSRARLNFIRTVAFLLPPVLCFAAFAVASLFSTRVTTPPHLAARVRVSPRNCGYINWNSSENYDSEMKLTAAGARTYAKWLTGMITSGKDYARSCYTTGTVDASSCSVLPVQQLPYTVDDSAPCPFHERRCALGRNSAYEMATPWLDSHTHFGINTPKAGRVSIRRVSTCSVLSVHDLASILDDPGSPYSTHLYRLGPFEKGGLATNNPTFAVSDFTPSARIPYGLQTFRSIAYSLNTTEQWRPIPDLQRKDADLTLFILNQNSMFYPEPVDDPFFSAHREATVPALDSHTIYTADNLTSFMACADQFQLLNNANNVSTSLSSMVAIESQRNGIGLSKGQQEIAWRLINPLFFTLIGQGAQGGDSLLASKLASYTLSLGLPPNQWQIELRAWFAEALAVHQLQVVAFASKDMEGLSPYGQIVHPELDSLADKLCESQIMRNTGGYQTFSVLGLALIGTIGFFIAVVSWVLESLVTFVRRKTGKSKDYHKDEAWRMDSMFNQQRLAFALWEKDLEWEKLDGSVPVTRPAGESFGRVRG
ncbi:hypothetical protein QBC44DRAFT_376080 [Cladorrhinum sp. PSN332]|nr:hypothetical protein QBC44DRAFT_376080 [Cladorrhinum sp. PSN332]